MLKGADSMMHQMLPAGQVCNSPSSFILCLVVAQVGDLAVHQDAGLPLVLAVAAAHAHVAGGALAAAEAPPGCSHRPLHPQPFSTPLRQLPELTEIHLRRAIAQYAAAFQCMTSMCWGS